MTPTSASCSSIVPKKIRVIGVPLDLGQSRRGVDMGPSAVRVAGLEARLEALGHVVEDGGNVAVAIPEQKKEGDPQREISERNHRDLHQAAPIWCSRRWRRAKCRIVLGGDHSVAAGTVAGCRRILPASKPESRPDLDRRAQRHQHARNFAQRQRAWHAAGGHHGPGSAGAGEYLRFLSQSERRKLCAGRHSRC